MVSVSCTYICIASYMVGMLHYHFIYVVSSSTIVTHPADTSAAAPYSAVFTCSIYGYGYQNITWHRKSAKLPYNHQINEVSSSRLITSTITIPNVTEQDVGKYYCQVWANDIRKQSEQANLYYAGIVFFTVYDFTSCIYICMHVCMYIHAI